MTPITQLSEHFILIEFISSTTASTQNITEQFDPPAEVVNNLKNLCQNLLEPLRAKISEKLGKDTPIHITSGYRCPRLNKAVGGVPNSQHQTGEAVDTHVDGMSIEEWYQFVKSCGIKFDQCIQEFDSWAHISYASKNRGECWRYSHSAAPKREA